MQVRVGSTHLADSSIAIFPTELRDKFGQAAFELVAFEDVHEFLNVQACDRIKGAVRECLSPGSIARAKVVTIKFMIRSCTHTLHKQTHN